MEENPNAGINLYNLYPFSLFPVYGMECIKIIKAKSWDELPETLEPGVYNVGGEIFTVLEDVPKEAIIRALKYKKMGKTLV